MNARNSFQELHDHLAEFETSARKLKNQNLADIIKSGMAKISQAIGHPDLEHAAVVFKADKEGEEIDHDAVNRTAEAQFLSGKPTTLFSDEADYRKSGAGEPFPGAPPAFNLAGQPWKDGDGQKFDAAGAPIAEGDASKLGSG